LARCAHQTFASPLTSQFRRKRSANWGCAANPWTYRPLLDQSTKWQPCAVIETFFLIFRSILALPKMGRLRLARCAHQTFASPLTSQFRRKPSANWGCAANPWTYRPFLDQSTKWQPCAVIETIFSDFSQHLHLAKDGKIAFGTLRPSNFCVAADITISSQTQRQLGLCRKPVGISAVP